MQIKFKSFLATDLFPRSNGDGVLIIPRKLLGCLPIQRRVSRHPSPVARGLQVAPPKKENERGNKSPSSSPTR